jgi:hypothetical protein
VLVLGRRKAMRVHCSLASASSNIGKIALGTALLASLVPLATADDLVPPPWVRGSDRTTTQEWEFNTPNDIFGHPIGPFGNPYGTAQVINPTAFVWFPDDSTFNPTNPNPRTGVVCIGPGGILKFLIPNQEDLTFQKLLWAQITWWADPGSNVVVTPLAPAPNEGSIVVRTPLGAGWFHTTARFTLAQQPAFEEFWVRNFTSDNIYVDQLVIDTKCVPEPASLAALILGIAGLAVRGRRIRA